MQAQSIRHCLEACIHAARAAAESLSRLVLRLRLVYEYPSAVAPERMQAAIDCYETGRLFRMVFARDRWAIYYCDACSRELQSDGLGMTCYACDRHYGELPHTS